MKINTKKYIEEYILIKDKDSKLIPFKLNEPQLKLYEMAKKQYEEGKPIRIIILKARQMGFSTLTEAIIFKETATEKNISSGIITHKEDATTNLFNMSKRMYDNLPTPLKPQIKASNAKELIFDTKDGKGMGSRIRCMTAGSGGVGRSDTINKLHISELAFWEGNKQDILTGLLQAIPNNPNSTVIIESTANGYEYFKEMWDKAISGENDFEPLFVGWNELDEYSMKYSDFDLTEEEEKLKETYNLTNEQLEWRRWCINNNCGGDIEKFRQEYPINPHEAFISTGSCVFDQEKLIKRLADISKPIKQGYFIYDYDGLKISDIKFVPDKKGYVKIYDVPRLNKYAIGGDTAGEGSDFFTGQVVSDKGEQVATLRHLMDEDLYAKQMYCLGRYYNNALIGIETNFSTYAVKELERLGYTNMYLRERHDTYTGRLQKSYGFKTTMLTRPLIVNNLITTFREQPGDFNDEITLKEMLTFVKNEKGKAEAIDGCNDDTVMAIAIAHHIKEQILYNADVIKVKPKFNFEIERELEEDWGEDIKIV